jgi:hypothetical protein
MNHYGAPPAPEKGRVELMGGIETVGMDENDHIAWHGSLSYGLSENWQLEFGADGHPDFSALGWAGFRYAPLNGVFHSLVKITLDVEGGAGAGAGGRNECYSDDHGTFGGAYQDDETSGPDCVKGQDWDTIPWRERAAGGAWVGSGIGLNIRWFDVFARGRVQLSTADNVPHTLWLSALFGVQGTIAQTIRPYGGLLMYTYRNSVDQQVDGMGLEFGLSLMFGSELFRATKNN